MNKGLKIGKKRIKIINVATKNNKIVTTKIMMNRRKNVKKILYGTESNVSSR